MADIFFNLFNIGSPEASHLKTKIEIGIDIYTLICIKWITNKNLLYKKINKIQKVKKIKNKIIW